MRITFQVRNKSLKPLAALGEGQFAQIFRALHSRS
jgi:hypothetical protein